MKFILAARKGQSTKTVKIVLLKDKWALNEFLTDTLLVNKRPVFPIKKCLFQTQPNFLAFMFDL